MSGALAQGGNLRPLILEAFKSSSCSAFDSSRPEMGSFKIAVEFRGVIGSADGLALTKVAEVGADLAPTLSPLVTGLLLGKAFCGTNG